MMAYPSVFCDRCGGERWPYPPPEGPYRCQRCRVALKGGNADDPLGSPAQQAARKAAGDRLRAQGFQRRLLGKSKTGGEDAG